MPKGRKRNSEEYEKEIDEAAKRMRKKPEGLKSARSSKTWLDFLDDIGISVNSTGKSDFWEQVRDKVYEREEIQVKYNVRRKLKSGKYSKPVTIYRSGITGRFISPKKD